MRVARRTAADAGPPPPHPAQLAQVGAEIAESKARGLQPLRARLARRRPRRPTTLRLRSQPNHRPSTHTSTNIRCATSPRAYRHEEEGSRGKTVLRLFAACGLQGPFPSPGIIKTRLRFKTRSWGKHGVQDPFTSGPLWLMASHFANVMGTPDVPAYHTALQQRRRCSRQGMLHHRPITSRSSTGRSPTPRCTSAASHSMAS